MATRYDLIVEEYTNILFVLKNGKWSVVNQEYKPIIPFKLDVMPIITDCKCIICKKDGGFGVWGLEGNELLPTKYSDIERFDNKKFVVTEGLQRKIIDLDKNIEKEYDYDVIRWNPSGYYYVQKSGRAGLLDSNYDIIIPTEYRSLVYLDSYFALVGDGKGKVHIFNLNLKERISKTSYKGVKKISQQYLAVKSSRGKWGVIDSHGNEVIDCIYDEYVSWNKISTIALKRKDKWTLLNLKDNITSSCVYEDIRYFCGSVFIVTKNKKQGIINSDNKEILPCEYDSITIDGYSRDSCIHVTQNGYKGLLNVECKFVIPVQYKAIRVLNEQAIVTNFSDLEGLVELKTGKIICEPKYRKVGGICNGLARVQNNEKLYGYIDKNGKEIIPCQYIEAENFHNGYAVVAKHISIANYTPLYGYINAKGKEETKFIYYEAGTVDSSGKADVRVLTRDYPSASKRDYCIKGKIFLGSKETSKDDNKV